MKTNTILLLLLVISIAIVRGQQTDPILAQANASYDAGDLESAQKLYRTAAEKGSADAHFAMAYKYSLTPEESIYHYSEAAKKGHAEALNFALEYLLFRAGNLRLANPQKALEVYTAAKKANPGLQLYDEENIVKTLQKCAAPQKFDVEKFIRQYNIDDLETIDYHIWELAEEASVGGRFGEPDPDLIFNLVVRGGVVPAELMAAVDVVYDQWKAGEVQEFNLCDHITSGMGGYFCALRASAKAEDIRRAKLDSLKQKLGSSTAALLDAAYSAASNFIQAKAETEEGHYGTGRDAFIADSESEQEDQYVELIAKIQSGFVPSPKNSLAVTDKELNATYRQVMQAIQEKNEEKKYPFTTDDIRSVQRRWILHRDATMAFWKQTRPKVDPSIWQSWLTEIRTAELQAILEMDYLGF